MATERQLELLNLIVDTYIKIGDPVSSGQIQEQATSLNLSSATIRNEMSALEEEGFITKLDASSSRTSGRIPTTKGYEYYLNHIKTSPDSIIATKDKLDEVLSDRKKDIDIVLKEAMEIINESTNTLTISNDEGIDSKLQDINCYPIGEDKAIIIIVTSDGSVINKELPLKDRTYEEFEKVIKTFSKRLRGTDMSELENNLESLTKLISIEVQGLEDKYQDIIKMLFTKITKQNAQYSGMNSIVTMTNEDVKRQINIIFKMIENNSIWDLIDSEGSITTTSPGVTVDMETMDGVSVVKKHVNVGNKNKQLTIVGAKNQDYEKLFSMLEYIDDMLKGWK